MTDDKAKFAHATSPGGRWLPCDVDSEEAAARGAAYEWAHRADEDDLVVLVGEAEWKDAEHIASLANASQVIEYIDEAIWEIGGELPLLREESTAEERAKLDARLVDVIADWVEEIGYPGFFTVPSWSAWRVTTLANEEGGPEVEKTEKEG